MKCPNCNATLVMSERQGIEIDFCPECRGVWLDRGELDKIIERSNQEHPSDERKHHAYDKRYKKKSMLGELFDF